MLKFSLHLRHDSISNVCEYFVREYIQVQFLPLLFCSGSYGLFSKCNCSIVVIVCNFSSCTFVCVCVCALVCNASTCMWCVLLCIAEFSVISIEWHCFVVFIAWRCAVHFQCIIAFCVIVFAALM